MSAGKMATYSNLDRDTDREQGLPSSVEETEEIHKKSDNLLCLGRKKEKNQSSCTIPYYKLFSLVDSFDYVLMFVGTIAALGNGICMPLMALLFGELIDTTGKTVSTTDTVQGVYKVSSHYRVALNLYLAICMIHRNDPKSISLHFVKLANILSIRRYVEAYGLTLW